MKKTKNFKPFKKKKRHVHYDHGNSNCIGVLAYYILWLWKGDKCRPGILGYCTEIHRFARSSHRMY